MLTYFKTHHLVMVFLLAGSATTEIRAEIPLPDVVVFGRLRDAGGAPIGSGDLQGVVRRGGDEVLNLNGQFVEEGAATFYFLRVPMETSIGAPGPSGAGARDGDRLDLSLDGQPVVPDTPIPALRSGDLLEVDARVSEGGGGIVFLRGDCNGDVEVDVSDAVRVLLFLFEGGSAPGCLRACDANEDSGVDMSDAVDLLNHVFLGTPALPPPAGACGPAPDAGGAPSCEDSSCA